MSHLALSYSAAPLCFSHWNIHNSNSITKFSCNSFTPFRHRTVSLCKTRHIDSYFRNNPNVLQKYALRCKEGHDGGYSFTGEDGTIFFNLNDDEDEIEDTGSPWEGAVMYKRNASILHMEYCTTLERLGLGFLSTDVSKNKASVMGLRVTKAVKDYPNGTPVQISVDVTRKRKKLRLDGIIKTVITLSCNRYFLFPLLKLRLVL
ncbi:hypothetical protein L195_g025564 [Trifolium pratense]|uniref:Uncharacterized protein n=1 Tax=Trifolium pratense TaxID=57577 RepID=A0A2K3NGW9_TRIPR|nr:hypothetical protein L195_g025564 [Trifolium pratense]